MTFLISYSAETKWHPFSFEEEIKLNADAKKKSWSNRRLITYICFPRSLIKKFIVSTRNKPPEGNLQDDSLLPNIVSCQ